DGNGPSGSPGVAKPPAQPASKGGKKTGNAQGQGTVKLTISPGVQLLSVVEAIDQKKAVFRFIPITIAATTGKAEVTLWTFADALMEKGTFRRLPCSAAESQQAA